MLTRTDTYLTGLIGAGIGTSLSPPLHEREAAELGLRYAYRTLDIERLDVTLGEVLARAVDAGYDGLNVTHPCKRAVLEHLDELSPDAEALGAVNTVVIRDGRTTGHNTDTTGFAESVRRGLPGAALERVALVGAGGAGSAVAHALRELGCRELEIFDADAERAAALADAVGARAVARLELADADGLVHATPTGMEGHRGRIALDPARLHPGLWVADIVYRPLETPLLRAARARGCRTLDGGGMLVFQAADSLELFTGARPDRERMLRHFAELTASGHSAPPRDSLTVP
jgi:quinate/shikimate dehydrogenase (NAD+)